MKIGYFEFRIGETVYAVPLSYVREVVPFEKVTPIPSAQADVLGLMTLREHLLPVVTLRGRLHAGGPNPESKSELEVLVLNVQGMHFGIQIDESMSVDQDESAWRISDENGDAFLMGVLHFDDRIVSVLNPEKFIDIDPSILARFKEKDRQDDIQHEETTSIVVFDVKSASYAFLMSDVREIVRYIEPYRIPDTPPWVPGVVNIRGRVIPLFDLVRFFGDMGGNTTAKSGKQDVVVVEYEGKMIGVVVDDIRRIMEMHNEHVQTPPSISGSNYLMGIVEIDGSIIGIFDKAALFESAEFKFPESETANVSGNLTVSDTRTFVSFVVGEKELGLPISCVREIVRVGERPSPVPGSPEYVVGTMRVRNDIVSVVDLGVRFGDMQQPLSMRMQTGRVLIVEDERNRAHLTGYLVDAVLGTQRIGIDDINMDASAFVSGIARLNDGGILQILDQRKL